MDAAGAWGGFLGGAVTGGAVTGGAVTIGPGRARVRKGPADEGPAGPLGVSTIRFCFLLRHRNYLEVLQGH